jgi:ATP-dependent helicase HrpA
LQCRKDSQYILKNTGVSPALQLAYNQLPKHPLLQQRGGGDFKQDLLYLIFSSVFVENCTIRNQQQFEASLTSKKSTLLTTTTQIGKQITEIMANYLQISLRLKQTGINSQLRQDVVQQLQLLVYSGFIRHTPLQQLQAIPRYLKAIDFRLEKQKQDLPDIPGLQRLWQRYWQHLEQQLKLVQPDPELDSFRWQLEELRVSVFAQQLKTAYPVSVQRLEKIWNERF